jgi:cell division transport system permease protein
MNTLDTTKTHMRRSPYQAMAAVLTMFLTFLLGGIFFLTTLTSSVVIENFESKPQITVFFTDEATQEDVQNLSAALESTGKVASTKYVSKDEALAIYKEQNKNDPLLLEMVTADILPASLEVSARDPKFLADLEPMVQSAAQVEEVVYQRDIVDSLLAWTNAIRIVGGVLATLLVIDSILITMTVIAMKVALRREEIDILKLVGASLWNIRAPFVLEGGLYGAFGAGVAGVIIVALVVGLRGVLYAFLSDIPSIAFIIGNPTAAPFILANLGFFIGLIIAGFALGAVGSMVTTARYLKF